MFHNSNVFHFTNALTKNWDVIRDEYLALSADTFDPWIQSEMYEGDWSVFGLVALGEPIRVAREMCPKTATILAGIPNLILAGFSRLAPHTHIQPHTGWAKNELRLHLGLVIPPKCKFRVGQEIKHWEEGHCLIFEDTTEHEAWNDSDSTRTVLLLDFLKPGLEKPSEEISENALNYAKKLLVSSNV
jgi:aspartyl/asparaginyl beta-hydroxylase (cupin superfamily)